MLFGSFLSAQPTISKVFTPSTIGPGSVSTITFTITNGSASPVTGLSFTDVLPAAITLADPANASTTCDLGVSGTLTAPDGGSTITLSDARLGGSSSCTVTVDVTASTPGAHTNPAVTLSSSAGSSMSLPVDLTVVTTLPGFSKSFAPSSVSVGEKSTLTFSVNNGANALNVLNLDFTDNLPTGMEIASPANASTTCGTATLPPTLTAVAGTSVITLDANGTFAFPAVAAGATCTVSVDVRTTGAGALDNISGDLLASQVSAGRASATLQSTVTQLAIQKQFTDDPVPPGNTATLEFTINNFNRNFSATGVAFTDDLTTLVPSLTGLTFGSLLSNTCGGSVTGVGGTTIGLSGGTIAAGGSCMVRVSLSVPAGATPGSYTNTTSTVTATVDGSPVVGNTASDDLFVEPVPLLAKEFLKSGTLAPNPVINPGDNVVIRFTVTNTSTTSMATNVAFLDELTDGGPGTGFLPFPVSVSLPGGMPCGAGSSVSLVSVDTDRQGIRLTGGTLAAAPGAGSTCTFDVTVTTPATLGPGIYVNTTEEVTATVDGAMRTGGKASDSLTVIAAPQLTKEFTDDPVPPGGTATLQFTLSYPADASGDATGISFTDNLTFLGGLTANLPPTPDPPCGIGSSLTGSAGNTMLTLMGGTLSPGSNCTFSVAVNVPGAAAPGTYTNTTSGVSATVQGLSATNVAASDNLKVSGLVFTKEFLNNPYIAGESGTLRFTIQNVHPTDNATISFFSDNLQTNLTGLAATGGPSMNTCGGSLSGTTFLTYVGGSVNAGTSCVIEVPIMVPATAADGTYPNITGSLTANQGGVVVVDPARADIIVNSNLLQLSKTFTDDPVAPGSSVTLDFNLTNLDMGQAASMIGFTDDLSAILPGTPDLMFNSTLANTCGATVSGTGTSSITVSGGSLAIGGTCTIRTSLTVPGGATAGTYTNTTSGVTGTINSLSVTGDAASDNLEIIQLLGFSKSFDALSTATGSAKITFTITNPGMNTAVGLQFTDDLNAVIPGLIATSLPAVPCGAGSSITGIGSLAFSGGELGPMSMCTFDVDVLVPASATAGTFPNTTSDLLASGLKVSDPATANLMIEPPPIFTKAFSPNPINPGGTSTLTFTINNMASVLAAGSLAFTDNLPAGVVIAPTPNASTSCTGGTITANAGAGVVSYTGGTVAAGASCTVQADVTSNDDGTYMNTSGDLTSSSGNSGSASATLTVNCATFEASLTGTTAVCINSSPAPEVTFNISGGLAPYTFNYTLNGNPMSVMTTGTNTSVTVSQATNMANTFTYILIGATDAAGCTAGLSNMGTQAVITVNNLPACSISGPMAVCASTTGHVYSGPAGMTSYAWTISGNGTINGASNAQNVTVDAGAAGTYTLTLTITDGNGCMSTCMQGVTVNSLPACSITGPTAVCTSTTGHAYSGPAGMTSYAWTISGNGAINGASNAQNVTVDAGAAGTYTLTLTIIDGNGCTSTCMQGVTVNALPACSITGPLAVCATTTGHSYSGPSGMSTYAWSISGNGTLNGASNARNVTVDAGAAGMYTLTLTITDGNGCMSTCMQTVTVNALPVCLITGPMTVCASSTGHVYSGPTGLTTYVWSISGNGTINGASNARNVTVDAGAAGMYTLTLTITDGNGCMSTCMQDVTVNGLPTATIMTTTEVCQNDPRPNVTFTGANGTAPYTFNYTLNGAAQPPLVTTSGDSRTISHPTDVAGTFTYELVSVSDANGCSQTQSGTVVITVNPLPLPPTNVTGPSTICPGLDNIPFYVTPGQFATGHLWTYSVAGTTINGDGTTAISVDGIPGSGVLSVVSTNACGQSAPVDFPIAFAIPEICVLADCSRDASFIDDQILALSGMTDVFKARNRLESDATIEMDKVIIFRSLNIDLYANFTVEKFATFRAESEGCPATFRDILQKN